MMNTVYDRLREWQTIPGAYEMWAAYREALTGEILQAKKEKGGRALVIGAGACNDLDLRRLLEAFDTLTLCDREEVWMREGIKRQLGAETERISYVQADFLGISDENYRSFCEVLQAQVNLYGKDKSVSELSIEALKMIEDFYEDAQSTFSKDENWDMIILCGFHSQFNNMLAWIWDAYCQALGTRENKVFQRVSEETAKRVKELHTWALGHADVVFFALENSRISVPGAVQGAYQGIRDLLDRANSNTIALTEYDSLIWPFDQRQGIFYEMRIFAARRE